MKLPIVGPTYQLDSFDRQRCVGWFPVISETGTSKEPNALFPTPGLKLYASTGDGPIRGQYTTARGRNFTVSGGNLYEIVGVNIAVNHGALLTQTGYIDMCDNGAQLLIVDGYYGYIFDLNTTSFKRINVPGFFGGTTCVFLDGYFIVSIPNSGNFGISGLYDGLSWDSTDVTTVESSPDNLLAVRTSGGYLWCVGSESYEIYYNDASAALIGNFPFLRVPGARRETGCASGKTVLPFNGGMVWLAVDDDGMRSFVYATNGSAPQIISTQAIDDLLLQSSDLSGSSAYAYSQGGRTFYCAQVQGLSTTLCFEAKTSQWHERVTLNEYGQEERHRIGSHAFFKNKNLVGDRVNGNIYEYDKGTYSDNGDEVPRVRIFPHIHDEMHYVAHYELHIDFEPGVGLTSGQGSDPQVMMRYSDDGGETWSNERWVTIGQKGKYKNRARFKRLGIARDRVYEIRVTDPVFAQINGAYLMGAGT